MNKIRNIIYLYQIMKKNKYSSYNSIFDKEKKKQNKTEKNDA